MARTVAKTGDRILVATTIVVSMHWVNLGFVVRHTLAPRGEDRPAIGKRSSGSPSSSSPVG